MSHFIGLVFVRPENNLEDILAPFNEQDDKYCEFVDCTDEVVEKFNSMPEHDEDRRYPCDKEKYPTIDRLAKSWFGYSKVNGKYGYFANPNAKWDWHAEGGRWEGYLTNLEGRETDCELLTEIDWDKVLGNGAPFCIVDAEGVWHERGEMGWWGIVSNEKGADDWNAEVKAYVQSILSDEQADSIEVYAIDFHI